MRTKILILLSLLCLSSLSVMGQKPITKPVRQKEQQNQQQKKKPKQSSTLSNKPTINTSSCTPSVRTYTVNGVSFRMVGVKGGTFRMGATSEQGNGAEDTEKPVHKVTLSSYYIGETEVTQALWLAVMGNNPSDFKGDDLPVENVSWEDCQTFIEKLNRMTGKCFRLPTEAEWEYAARGGSKSQGYKYSGSNNIDDVAWYDGNVEWIPAVGQLHANELGLYDMSGNVYEWCQDWYGPYSSGSQTNPTGPSSGSERVMRGGCRYSYDESCRSSFRDVRRPTDYHGNGLGLRIALSE